MGIVRILSKIRFEALAYIRVYTYYKIAGLCESGCWTNVHCKFIAALRMTHSRAVFLRAAKNLSSADL
jgi:hypothetical protein